MVKALLLLLVLCSCSKEPLLEPRRSLYIVSTGLGTCSASINGSPVSLYRETDPDHELSPFLVYRSTVSKGDEISLVTSFLGGAILVDGHTLAQSDVYLEVTRVAP
jgi:hypothetical protein